MSSPAKRKRERVARERRAYQAKAAERQAFRDRARASWEEERRRMGFGIDIVTDVPAVLRDVTYRRSATLMGDQGQ